MVFVNNVSISKDNTIALYAQLTLIDYMYYCTIVIFHYYFNRFVFVCDLVHLFCSVSQSSSSAMLVTPPVIPELFCTEFAPGNSGNVGLRCFPGAGGTGGKSTDLL